MKKILNFHCTLLPKKQISRVRAFVFGDILFIPAVSGLWCNILNRVHKFSIKPQPEGNGRNKSKRHKNYDNESKCSGVCTERPRFIEPRLKSAPAGRSLLDAGCVNHCLLRFFIVVVLWRCKKRRFLH